MSLFFKSTVQQKRGNIFSLHLHTLPYTIMCTLRYLAPVSSDLWDYAFVA